MGGGDEAARLRKELSDLRAEFQKFAAVMGAQVEAIRQAFNKNHLAYSDALRNLDARAAIAQAVINDAHDDKLTLATEGHIDWEAYLELYKERVKQVLEEDKSASDVPDTVVQEMQDEVFGGDYGSRDRSVSESGEESPG